MSKKIGVVLAGCGVYDGSEIHEAVLTLLALDRAGAEVLCIAPNMDQAHVINHLTGEVAGGEKRNVLVESARIARGNVVDIATVKPEQLSALVIPGGFGAAKNLCNFAFVGEECVVNAEVKKLIQAMALARKPIAAICIAPTVLTKALSEVGIKPTVTIGTDKVTAAKIGMMGGIHENQPVRGVTVDKGNRIVTSPAYMLGQSISEVADGINNTIAELMKLL